MKIISGVGQLFRWEQQGWTCGVILFTQSIFEVLLERQCEIVFLLQHISLSFMLSTLCRKPAFIRMRLKVLVEFLSQIFRKHSLHFILIFRVWRMSSYWMQTCMVLKIWLTIALKICYTLVVLWCTKELCPHVHCLIKNSYSGVLPSEVLVR